MRSLVCVCFAGVMALSCTTYRTLTPPPPGRVAALDSSDNVLRISQGVGFAFECVTGGGNPCAEGKASVDDPMIAKVYPAHLTRVDRYRDGSFRPTSYVVVGVSPGQTVLRIPGEDPLRVFVVP